MLRGYAEQAGCLRAAQTLTPPFAISACQKCAIIAELGLTRRLHCAYHFLVLEKARGIR